MGTIDLLRDRAVGTVAAVELLCGLAIGATVTALGWQAYERSGDPLVLGLLGLAEFIPALLLALPAGHVADHYDRRWVIALGLAGVAVVTAALAADAASGDSEVWPLYVLAFLMGVAYAFVPPAFDPMMAAAVPAESLSQATAISVSGGQAAMIAGPALGGLLQHVGAPAPYILAAAATAVAAALALFIPRAVGRAHVAEQETTLGDALGGVRYIRANPPLLGAISLDLVAVLFGGVTALLPVFASDILDVGAVGNGLLRAAPGVGAVMVGLVLAVRPLRARVGPTLLAMVMVYGVFTIVFGLSRSFALSFLALAGLAAADMVSMLLRATLCPLLTPPQLRGRVSAVERVFIGASNELGAFESGVAAALIGAVPAVLLGGVASIAAAALWAWGFPSLRRIDRFEDVRPLPESAAPDSATSA